MSKKDKNTNKEPGDFLRYSQGKMSHEERNAFERSLQRDPFETEAEEGLSSIAPEEVQADLAKLQDRMQKRTRARTGQGTRTMWYRIAASVAVLLVVTSVLFTIFNDRLGELDREVADSPVLEKEEIPAAPPKEEAGIEVPVEILPVQTIEEDEKPLETAMIREEGSAPDTPEKIPETETIEMKAMAAEAEADLRVEQLEEMPEIQEELADLSAAEQTEEGTDIHANEMVVIEIQPTAGLAAPAMAAEKKASRARKMDAADQAHMAGIDEQNMRVVSGIVVSAEDNQPLPGAVLALKGSNTGTVTDQNGEFQISVEDESDNTLIAQFIGMESKEIPLRDQEELLISMKPDIISLEEVVVIGSGAGQVGKPLGNVVALADIDEGPESIDYVGALPVGGRKEYNDYIKNSMRFPEQEDVIAKAVVVLNFVVNQNGRPEQIFVLKSPGKAFSDEAIRLLDEGPEWRPAEMNGQFSDQSNRILIVFKREKP